MWLQFRVVLDQGLRLIREFLVNFVDIVYLGISPASKNFPTEALTWAEDFAGINTGPILHRWRVTIDHSDLCRGMVTRHRQCSRQTENSGSDNDDSIREVLCHGGEKVAFLLLQFGRTVDS